MEIYILNSIGIILVMAGIAALFLNKKKNNNIIKLKDWVDIEVSNLGVIVIILGLIMITLAVFIGKGIILADTPQKNSADTVTADKSSAPPKGYYKLYFFHSDTDSGVIVVRAIYNGVDTVFLLPSKPGFSAIRIAGTEDSARLYVAIDK